MKVSEIKDKIFEGYEERNKREKSRTYVGASSIGVACDRDLFYRFRQCHSSKFAGRILRLFRRGHDMEPQFIEELRKAGLEVKPFGDDGKQFESVTAGGHSKCHADGVVIGLDEYPDQWGLLEMKTHGDKSFKELIKGVSYSKPEHFAQCQFGMGLMNLPFALYVAENKNTSDLYLELIPFDEQAFKYYQSRAESIIQATVPPEKISDKLDWYQCKFCDAYGICKQGKIPKVNCCTCCHSTPIADGKWGCKGFIVPDDVLLDGCPEHLFIPDLLPFEVEDSDEGWVRYTANGNVIYNVAASGFPRLDEDDLVYSSVELFDLGGK